MNILGKHKPDSLVRVVVNKHIVKANEKHGTEDPPISIQVGGKIYRARTVQFHGAVRLVYEPGHPLKCGARVWMECAVRDIAYVNDDSAEAA